MDPSTIASHAAALSAAASSAAVTPAMLAARPYTQPARRNPPRHAATGRPQGFSPLMLADRLITLAQDADRAGYHDAASHLVTLVYAVLDAQSHGRAPA